MRPAAGFSRGAAFATLALAFNLGSAAPGLAAMQTTTTTYQYNADGALAAVTTQVDAQIPTTVYLTWDDYVPSAGAPTAGTVTAGNGNLLGFGPSPGSAGLTTQFQYDPRNRLIDVAPSPARSESYTYYPASLMATSTLGDADALQFYYGIGATPQVTNIQQPSTSRWSTYLGDATYLSGGAEQVRCRPRKDVAGVYEPAPQSFTAQRYDPYGSPASGSSAGSGRSTYDMQQNPFQYDGEYQDPVWGGYYLRARWYLPQYQTFLQRDPADATHHYSYAGGDPIGSVDPSGLRFTCGEFSRSVNNFLRPVNHGLLGDLLPLVPVYGQVVGGIQLLGNLPQVWHHPNFETWASFSFLAAAVATEAGDSLPVFDRGYGALTAFQGRLSADAIIGVGQTALAASGPHGKLDVGGLIQSISYNASGIFWGRAAAGFGYRPYGMTEDDVTQMMRDHYQDPENAEQGLVFRVRYRPSRLAFTSPIMEQFGVGNYHEALFGVTRDRLWLADVNYGNWRTRWAAATGDPTATSEFLAGHANIPREYIFAGKYQSEAISGGLSTEVDTEQQYHLEEPAGRLMKPLDKAYNKITNNCQQNAARMRTIIADIDQYSH